MRRAPETNKEPVSSHCLSQSNLIVLGHAHSRLRALRQTPLPPMPQLQCWGLNLGSHARCSKPSPSTAALGLQK